MTRDQIAALYDSLAKARSITLGVNAHAICTSDTIDKANRFELHNKLCKVNHELGDMLHILDKLLEQPKA